MEKSSAEGALDDKWLPGLLAPTPRTGWVEEGWELGYLVPARPGPCWGEAGAPELTLPGCREPGNVQTHAGQHLWACAGRGKFHKRVNRKYQGVTSATATMLGDGVEGDKRAPFRGCDQSCLMKEAASELRPEGEDGPRPGVPGMVDGENKGSGMGSSSVDFKEP